MAGEKISDRLGESRDGRRENFGWRKVGMAGDRTSDRFDVFRASLEKHRAAICGGIVRWHVMLMEQGKTSYVLQKIMFG